MAIRIIKNQENPETPEILAEAIIKIADSFEKLLKTELNENAIIQLVLGMPGTTGRISKSQIKLVLKNLKTLKGYYLRKK